MRGSTAANWRPAYGANDRMASIVAADRLMRRSELSAELSSPG
jgi:hypothetical protein